MVPFSSFEINKFTNLEWMPSKRHDSIKLSIPMKSLTS